MTHILNTESELRPRKYTRGALQAEFACKRSLRKSVGSGYRMRACVSPGSSGAIFVLLQRVLFPSCLFDSLKPIQSHLTESRRYRDGPYTTMVSTQSVLSERDVKNGRK